MLRRSQYVGLFIVCGRMVYERRIVNDLEGIDLCAIKETSWYFFLE